jgi:hypothetical protein
MMTKGTAKGTTVRRDVWLALTVCLGVTGCDSSTGPGACDVELAGGSCLVFEDAGALADHRAGIETAVTDAVTRVVAVMPVAGVAIRIRANPAGAIPEIGLGGFNPGPHEVVMSLDPGFSDLGASIRDELGPNLAHELHHARRRQLVGYGSTLFQAMVSEGLADHFSVEVFGIPAPIWSTALTSGERNAMRTRAEGEWNKAPYDHAGWFLGTDPSIPRWTGYTLGFELVADHLEADPARTASGLVGEAASAFAP